MCGCRKPSYNESPHIYSQCCFKKILMFDYISLTNLYDEYLILLVVKFFNIDNPRIQWISSYIITMMLQENLNVWLYQFIWWISFIWYLVIGSFWIFLPWILILCLINILELLQITPRLLDVKFFNIRNPHITYSQCCCKKILMFGYISLFDEYYLYDI